MRRAAERSVTAVAGRRSAHSFSFGAHYDASNTSFGVLVAVNEEVLAPGAGFAMHPHRDLEIVTWVLSGALVHEDLTGGSTVVVPGQVQRLSAGTGVQHAETNDAWGLTGRAEPAGPLHLVQMWVLPDRTGLPPEYELVDVGTGLQAGCPSALREPGSLVPLASGRPGSGAVQIRNASATLHVAHLRPGQDVELPDAPYTHLHVARGAVDLEGVGPLAAGDAGRCTAVGGLRATAIEGAELLVWEMAAGLVP